MLVGIDKSYFEAAHKTDAVPGWGEDMHGEGEVPV
jgi:hypothetical protein